MTGRLGRHQAACQALQNHLNLGGLSSVCRVSLNRRLLSGRSVGSTPAGGAIRINHLPRHQWALWAKRLMTSNISIDHFVAIQ
jgi:hypothetical protein